MSDNLTDINPEPSALAVRRKPGPKPKGRVSFSARPLEATAARIKAIADAKGQTTGRVLDTVFAPGLDLITDLELAEVSPVQSLPEPEPKKGAWAEYYARVEAEGFDSAKLAEMHRMIASEGA